MALNGRAVMDPRWAYQNRPVVGGTMWGKIEVRHPVQGATSWNAAAGDLFTGTTGFVLLYRGRARLQPNNDWRARKQRTDGEVLTEHAMRVQLDLQHNEIQTPHPLPNEAPGGAGLMDVNDQIKITEIYSPYGSPIDGINLAYTFTIRVVNSSSNSWARTVLCDYLLNNSSGVPV